MTRYTPRTVIKTQVTRCSATFSHYGCRAVVILPDRLLSECSFYGNDGRKVRKQATDWVHAEAERYARMYATAWRDVRDSQRAPWEPLAPLRYSGQRYR